MLEAIQATISGAKFLWQEKSSFEILMLGAIFCAILGGIGFSNYNKPEEKNVVTSLSLSDVTYVQVHFKSGYSESVPFKDGKSTITVTSEKLELDETKNNILYVKQIQH